MSASPAFEAAAQVVDPELRVVTIAELGILRGVDVDGDRAVVTITPTYSGCPALDVIRTDIAAALRRAGYAEVEIVTRLQPAWTTDRITESGRGKLAAAGIAPPAGSAGGSPAGSAAWSAAGSARRLLVLTPAPAELVCPRCGSDQTEQVSRFGATACTSLWRCRACAEPFPHFKAL